MSLDEIKCSIEGIVYVMWDRAYSHDSVLTNTFTTVPLKSRRVVVPPIEEMNS